MPVDILCQFLLIFCAAFPNPARRSVQIDGITDSYQNHLFFVTNPGGMCKKARANGAGLGLRSGYAGLLEVGVSSSS